MTPIAFAWMAVTLAAARLPPREQRVAYTKRLRASKIDPHLHSKFRVITAATDENC
jgi:hypothetical protein